MYAVGKLGSYISQGVYTVSGPFHPFGGAVDIIVVQQEDGTFKSSPWHVKFGKFQGVLKTREKVVNICVDGVDAGFHMYLNHKGEAYFLRDSDDDDDVVEKIASPRLEKAMSPRLEPAASSRRSRIFGLMFGGRSMKKEGVGAERMDSLERAEIAADLLDMKWETDLAFGKRRDDVPGERTEDTVGGFETSSAGKEKCEEVTVLDSPRIPADVIDVHLQEPIDIHMNNDDSDDALFGSVGEKGDGFGTNMAREVHSDVIDVDLQEPTAKDICLNNDDSDDALFGSVGEKGDGLGTNMAREVHSEVIDVDLQEPTAKDICLNNDDSDGALFGSVGEKGDGLGTNMAREVHSDVIDVDLQEPIAKDICMNNDDSNDALLGSVGEKDDGLGTNMVRDVHSEEAAHEEVSEPVLIESDECNISSDRSVPSNSTSDLQCSCSVPFPGGQEEAALERVGSSTVNFDVTSDQTDKDLNISFEGSRPTENPSEVLCESSVQMPDVKPKMDPDECTGEKNCDAFGYQDLGIAEVEGYSVFQNAHADSPRYPSAIANGSSAESPLSSCFTESHVICEGKPADDAPQEKETINEVMKVIEDQSPTNTESSGSNLDYPVTDEIFSISDDEAQDSKELKNRSNVEISIADTMKDEVFHFTDTDSFAVKETGPQEPHKDAIVEPDVSVLVTDCDAARHELEDESSKGSLECVPEVPGSQTSPMSIPRRKTHLEDGKLLAKSLPLMHSQIHGIETSNLLHLLSCSLDSNFEEYAEDLLKEKISLSSKLETNYEVSMLQDNHIPETVASAAEIEQGQEVTTISPLVEPSLCKNLLCEGMGDDAASGVFSVEKGVENHSIDPSRATVLSEESWKLWPFSFKRSKSISTVRSLPETINMENVDIALSRSQTVTAVDKVRSAKFIKKKVRSLTPTSEELASLNLKEGQNVLTFSFSTAMLGQQQVDARIYLWKWNTRIVISDVDGTITKSDVLGQFMPLVGLDWYQTGVVHLFSAIKENGYQMLFLSARSISQAYLTRQFLLNLRQDGKSLPDGPVVISPDGLFPSLYREVIRRVPHEFKISCLEDIRALFPPECNPFYAGFGNRDTDEISYLKVGIPKGKIFIVNPKGEIAMSRRVDGKSYISLHALVHGMFPPVSSAEQEDFNSWNYWKLPLPDIDN